MIIIYFFLITSFLFPQLNNTKAELIEFDFGWNNPTGEFDKYANSGFSIRVAYSKSFNQNGLFKWQAGAQYILFKNNHYNDQFVMETFDGPTVNVINSEQAYIINGGVRLTATNGLLKKGNFRPYIGANVGLAFFSETTEWSWGNLLSDCNIVLNILFENYDCHNSNNSMKNTLDFKIEPVFTLDLGSNLFFSPNHKFGVDLGIRYNMVTGLKRPDVEYELTNEESGYFEEFNSNLSKKLQADYYTWYIGVSIKLDSNRRQKRKDRKGPGKLI